MPQNRLSRFKNPEKEHAGLPACSFSANTLCSLSSNEPEDPAALVTVSTFTTGHLASAAEKWVEMPLNKRTRLHEFIDKPNPYKCEILVGDETKRTIIEIDPKKYTGGDYSKLRDTIMGGTFSCLGITVAALVLTSAYLPAAKKIVANEEKAIARGLIGFRDGSKFSKDNFGSKLVGLMSGVAFCSNSAKGVFEKMGSYQNDEAHKVFFEYMQLCSDAAEEKLNQDLNDQEKYLAYRTAGRTREAAAVFTPYFVLEFN